jgi:hypothetical protein
MLNWINKNSLLILLLTTSFAFSQKHHMSYERMKAIKMTYIAEKCEFTTAEEKIFWEVFDRFEDEIFESCRKPMYTLRKNAIKNRDQATEKEVTRFIKDYDSLEQLMLTKKQDRNKELLKKLPAKKVLEIFTAEDRFNRHALQIMNKSSEKDNENHP